MPTSYSTLLGLALPVTGELSGTWGDEVNNYITQYLDSAVAGTQTISGSQTAVTLSRTTNAALSQAGSGSTGSSQYQVINCTGNPASALTVTVPSTSKVYLVLNNTSTNQTVTVKGAATTGVTVAAARCALIAWNGTDFELVATDDASKMNGVLAVANGGTGLSSGTSGGVPYFSGTTTIASSAALSANALVVGGGAGAAPSTVTTGTGVVTALGVNTGSAGAFVVNGGALGTPSSGTLTNATGLPVSTGVSGLGTGVATALGTAVGTAGAFVVNGGALGTPSSGTVTNLTGTASININGTVGATTANTGNFTSVTSTSETVTGAGGVLVRNAATQDGVELIGRAGGTTSLKATITPTTLTASRTFTLPDNSGTVLTTGATVTVAQGGTGQTTYTDGQLLIGNTATTGLNKATLTAGSGVTITNGNGTITIAATGSGGTVTSVGATAPVASSGGNTPTISLNSAYGDTLNPYGSKTANFFLAAPNGSAGAPTFRAIVAADIPTLNQNTTGTASNVTGTVAIANGGTGQTTKAAAYNALSPITSTGDLIIGNGVNSATRLAIGTNGQVLQSNGTTASWVNFTSGASLANDTATTSNLFPLFANATTGTPTTIYTSNAKLLYKPSTGELQSSAVVASNGIVLNNTTVSASYTIASGTNGMSVGPITVASGQSVTVASGQRWLVL